MPFVVCCALVYFWTLRFSRIGDFYTLRLGFFGNLDLRIIPTPMIVEDRENIAWCRSRFRPVNTLRYIKLWGETP